MCLNFNRKYLCFERFKYLMRFLKIIIVVFYEKGILFLRFEKDCLLYKERNFYIFNV